MLRILNQRRMMSLSAALALVFCCNVSADDWPQWRGAKRDGKSTETGLMKKWPKDGPRMAWKIEGLGAGFSTPSVADGKIYVVGTLDKDKEESLIALDEKNGKQLWAVEIGKSTGGHAAPRSTPTVDGDLVYVISSDGKLVCASKGLVKWSKDLKKDFGGRSGGWAYAESPLIDNDVLVCTPGGSTATMLAVDKKTGEVKWKAPLPDRIADSKKKRSYSTAGYSSAIVADVGGTRQYVQFIDGGVVGVDAKDGTFLWNYNEPANGTANCSTPIVHDGAVFAASAYGNGGGKANLSGSGNKWTAKQEYFIKSLQNHHGGMVLVGEHVYGTGSNSLMCVNYKTGDVAWQDRSVGKGSVCYADGHLYVRSERGPIALVQATPEGYKEKGRFDQPDRSSKQAWAHPVVANGKLYIRDWDRLFCYDIESK